MANTAAPFGLRPVRHINGSAWNGHLQKCYVSSAYGTALYIGDPVCLTPTSAEKDATAKYPTVNTHAGTTGLIVRGVIVSVEPNPNDLTKVYIPALTGGYVYIAGFGDPSVVFQIQDGGDGTPAATWPGKNAEMAAGSGGSTVTGLSSFVLDATTPTTTQAFPLHIIGLSDLPKNELADYAIWDVLINTNYNTTGLYLGIDVS